MKTALWACTVLLLLMVFAGSSHAAPIVITSAATSVTTTGARLNGSVNPNGRSTTAWFEWGTSPTLATFTSTSQPVRVVQDGEPSGQGESYGSCCRDNLLLPGGRIQLRGNL